MGKKSTYFKVNPDLLREDDLKQKIHDTWKEAANTEKDPRIRASPPRERWELKWKAAREVLKEQKRKLRSKLQELKMAREKVAEEGKSTPDEKLLHLEAEVSKLEQQKAAHWRRLSRVNWIQKGDAPSSFFFSLLRAKQKRKEISKLRKDDGTWIEAEDEILAELYDFYSRLLQVETETEEAQALRQQILSGMDKRK
ncbi:hypothetical protein R1sor_016007 [Riccia sorocarpa]|uniref:Uncharacterized protein n=1 Tax=Riccia sorocarpa TaxID=122646 RepID=A0ABD3HE57_9MARC